MRFALFIVVAALLLAAAAAFYVVPHSEHQLYAQLGQSQIAGAQGNTPDEPIVVGEWSGGALNIQEKTYSDAVKKKCSRFAYGMDAAPGPTYDASYSYQTVYKSPADKLYDACLYAKG